MQAHPGQVAIEILAVFARCEIAVADAPVGNRAGDAVDDLADARLAFGSAGLAVEILADDDVRRQALHVLGTSQSVCSKRMPPPSSLICAVRLSHSTVSNGSISGGQN